MIKSFMEFMQLKNEEDNQSMGTKQTANDLIKDLLHFKLGDKLLYNNKPIQIENIIVDATDSNKKRIHQTLHSVKEAADFIDNNTNLMDGSVEAYFGNNPIYLLNISNGVITRHYMADKLLQQVKPIPANIPADDSPFTKMQSYGEHKKILSDL